MEQGRLREENGSFLPQRVVFIFVERGQERGNAAYGFVGVDGDEEETAVSPSTSELTITISKPKRYRFIIGRYSRVPRVRISGSLIVPW